MKVFSQKAHQYLEGEWLIIGGSLLHFLKIHSRVTTDIDLAPIDPGEKNSAIQLIRLSEALKLPIETINMAAAFYLYRVNDYKKHLICIIKTEKFTLYRPDCYLYIALKINRHSESDIDDCRKYIEYARTNGEQIQKEKIIRAIKKTLAKEEDKAVQKRLGTLLSYL